MSRDTESRVLIIPDLHTPYQHPKAISFLRAVKASVKPTRVMCIGDEIDAHTLSRYSHDPDLPGPRSELKKSRRALDVLYADFPTVDVCESNHTFRAYRQAYNAGIPGAYLKPIGEVLGAPEGWRWAQTWNVDGVLYAHGDGFGGKYPAANAAERFRQSTAIGHIHHAAGVYWLHGVKDRIFGLSVGCLINPKSPAFSYAKFSPSRPALGCAVIENGVPRFIPLD